MSLVEYVDRTKSNCDKWNNFRGKYEKKGLIGLWVADMDFKCPKEVLEALKEYVEFGVIGYSTPKESYYEEFIKWEKEEHNVEVKKDWIRFSSGVVAAINWFLNMYTETGASIMINPPVYYPFSDAIKNNKRNIIESKLIEDNMYYSMDFEDMERKIKENNVSAYILCNPHNPVGRVWRKEEIEKIVEICKKNNVLIISDEIHQDLNFKGLENTSLINYFEEYDNIVVATAASKTFNIAACKNSFIVIKNKELRDKFDEYTLRNKTLSGNYFGYLAVEAAYKYGKAWLNEVKDIIYKNFEYVKSELDGYKGIRVASLEGTYLLWIDMRSALSGRDIHEFMEKKCKLAFDYGEWFGGKEYEGYIRMNLATSIDIIKEAVEEIKKNI